MHALGQCLHTLSSLKCLQKESTSISTGWRTAGLQRALSPSGQALVTLWALVQVTKTLPALPFSGAWLRGSGAHCLPEAREV